jgi:hypothetical protein
MTRSRSVLWYALASWRAAPDVPPGAQAFTVHRESGCAILFGALAAVSLMEASLVHFLVLRWSLAGAWAITAINMYAAAWMAGVARSFALRPVLLTPDELVVRGGLLWSLRIPRGAFAVDSPGDACDLRIPALADPNIVLRLPEPAVAHGMYGLQRRVSRVGLGLDDAAAFRKAVLNW